MPIFAWYSVITRSYCRWNRYQRWTLSLLIEWKSRPTLGLDFCTRFGHINECLSSRLSSAIVTFWCFRYLKGWNRHHVFLWKGSTFWFWTFLPFGGSWTPDSWCHSSVFLRFQCRLNSFRFSIRRWSLISINEFWLQCWWRLTRMRRESEMDQTSKKDKVANKYHCQNTERRFPFDVNGTPMPTFHQKALNPLTIVGLPNDRFWESNRRSLT